MSNVFQLYGRPLEETTGLPPLSIAGSLGYYSLGQPYEGRLQINNSIGKCKVEIVKSDLPPGASAHVDNFTKEIVLTWPAFSLADIGGVPNGNFEDGEDGWDFPRDWSVVEYGQGYGKVAQYDGWGESIVSATAMQEVTPGTIITGSVNVQQGASKKWSVWGFAHLTFYDKYRETRNGGTHEGPGVGDGARGAWHRAYVTAKAPSWAEYVTMDFGASRRKERKPIWLDAVQWDHEYPSGARNDTEYSVTFKVTDSANRVAFWSGVIYEDAIYLTSHPYAVEVVESVGAGGTVRDAYVLQSYRDDIATGGYVVGATLMATVSYVSYDHPGRTEEAVAASGAVIGAELVSTVSYQSYTHLGNEAEAVAASGVVAGATITVTTSYISYEIDPADEVAATGTILGATLE